MHLLTHLLSKADWTTFVVQATDLVDDFSGSISILKMLSLGVYDQISHVAS